MSFVGRDVLMNNLLIFKCFLTSEREVMFKEIAKAMKIHCDQVKIKRGISESKDIEAIMTDLTSHCGREFRNILAPSSLLGHTLFHVTISSNSRSSA